MNRTLVGSSSCTAAILVLASSLLSGSAAGLWLYERGAPEVGTANAGVAARAQDAATVVGNPAGMTRLTEPQFMFTVQPLIMDIKFQPQLFRGSRQLFGKFSGTWQVFLAPLR